MATPLMHASISNRTRRILGHFWSEEAHGDTYSRMFDIKEEMSMEDAVTYLHTLYICQRMHEDIQTK